MPELPYTGSFQDYLTSDTGAEGFVQGLSPNGFVVNLNVTYQVTPALQLFAWGKNIANSRFEPANGYQIPGPNVLAGARVGF